MPRPMSRRHHGRSHQGGRYRHEPPRPAPGIAPSTTPASVDAPAAQPNLTQDATEPQAASAGLDTVDLAQGAASGPDVVEASGSEPAPADRRPSPPEPARINGHQHVPQAAHTNGQMNGHAHAQGHANGQDRGTGCTAPQLRRFIKSRPYVPMHELRRRFAIDGGDDEVTQVSIAQGHVYVGLPAREGSLLGELLRGGEIGYELSLDPRTPVVVGVYPMRPVPRS
jgi:hypothetical protein